MDNHDEIKKSVLQAIQSGRIKMRPRWHFVLGAALAATGIFILGLALLYLVSFILFMLKASGAWFAPSLSPRGWFTLLQALPWLLILLCLLFVVLLELLVRRYAFAYQKPLLYSSLGVIIIAVAGGFIVFQTPLHRALFRTAEHGGLPMIGGFYRGYGMPRLSDVHPGIIVATDTAGFIIQEPFDNGTETVVPANGTPFPAGTGILAVGDSVVVFGVESGTVIQAVGFREFSPADAPFDRNGLSSGPR